MTRRQLAGLFITILGFASIAVATLTPVHGNLERSPWWCVTCGSIVMADTMVNVALFIPAGIGLALLSRRTVVSIALLALASVVVEVSQALVVPGRDTALRDVLANTLGAAVGVEVVHRWRLWLVPDATRALRLALVAAAMWALTLGATVELSHPSTPLTTLFGQRSTAPDFSGQVVRVGVNGAVVPLGVLDPWPVFGAFNSDNVRVEVVFVAGVPGGASEPVARISNEQTEAFRLSQRGRDLVFSIRTRAADVGLRSPIVRLADAVVTRADAANERHTDTVSVLGRLHRGVLSLRTQGVNSSTAALRMTPATGWVYFAPTGITTRVPSWLIDGLWVATLLFPVGYWSAAAVRGDSTGSRRARTRWILSTTGLAVVGPLALVAPLMGAPGPAWSAWCFAMSGLLVGALVLRMVRGAVRAPA